MSGSSAPAAPAADWRMPSRVRSFRIYSGQNSLSPTRAPNPLLYKWSPKHPLEANHWWVNAEALCGDLQDVILTAGYSVIDSDGVLVISEWCLTDCGRWAGFWLEGGTPGLTYKIRLHLTFAASRASWAGDVMIQVAALGPVPVPDPGLITNNGDIVLLGGIPFPTGA